MGRHFAAGRSRRSRQAVSSLGAAMRGARSIARSARLPTRAGASRVEHESRVRQLLATAERNARASARAARIATGAIPVRRKLAYQLAMVERDGDLSDKLDALGELWDVGADGAHRNSR